jgi:ribosomal protein S27AE
MRIHECPKCGALMEYEDLKPDVGLTGRWACLHCGHTELADRDGADIIEETIAETVADQLRRG